MTVQPQSPVNAPVSPRTAQRLVVSPLGLTEVEITDGFWAEWQQLNREVTAPHALRWLERDGSVENLRQLADGATTDTHRGMWFSDSDVYKVLEALSWDLAWAPSDGLNHVVSTISDVLRRAQRDDGYVNSYVQAGHESRWENLVMSHEFYCIGHLIQAGVAHRRATGRDELFSVARRAADCVVRDFGEHRRKDTDGHPVIEMALVELYRETGDRAYLQLAQQLVDVRGRGVLDPGDHFDSKYYQDATPVRQETTVVGHAVRALYLLSGVVDLYLETGEQALLDSALRQWTAMTASKTYLTGAVGSRFEGEAFGDEYELPPDLVYGETCATIGGIMLSWRLLLATGESRFADSIERALCNLFAGSTAIGRDAFFYSNPAQRRSARPAALEDTRPSRSEAPGTRPAWFKCSCCPPNIMRTVASLGHYVATHNGSGIQLHQYLPATIRTDAASVRVDTAYPLDGAVTVTVTASGEPAWTLSLRVPGWCRGASVTVNGAAADEQVGENGYIQLTREWHAGDVVVLDLPMPVRLTVSHPAVDAVRGTVAVERGPLVYCFEDHDQPDDVDLNHVELLANEPLEMERRDDFLGAPTVVIHAVGFARDDRAWGLRGWATLGDEPTADGHTVRLTAIPYHLWANRGPSVMRTFIPVR
jgi:uncharacterized protein